MNKFIKTVKNQLNYFYKELNKKEKEKEKYVSLICEHQDLLNYLVSHQIKKRGHRAATIAVEEKLLNIIKIFPTGVHLSKIKLQLEKDTNSVINESTMANRIQNMCRNRKLIKKIRKGVYKAV